MKFRLNSRGDTILEVMICVAVVGMILTAAFSLSNKNSTAQLMSQERSQASKVLDTQVELLKTYADTNKLPDRNMIFCMQADSSTDESNNTGTKINELKGSTTPVADRSADSSNNYSPDCTIGRYSVAIWSPGKVFEVGGTPNLPYGITVRWAAANGGPVEEVKTFYAIFDSSNPNFEIGGTPDPACKNGRDDDGDGKTDFDGAGDPTKIDLGCLGNENRTSEVNPACIDGINNDPSEDNLIDANDPGCWSNPSDSSTYDKADNDETDPPPPPKINSGINYVSCVPLGPRACERVGNSVVNCDNYYVEYDYNNSRSGNYNLRLNYSDYNCNGAGFPTPPAGRYQYRIKIYVNNESNPRVTTYLNPPNGNPLINLGQLPANPRIQIRWDNNEWVSNGSNPYGYDPDFMINNVELSWAE